MREPLRNRSRDTVLAERPEVADRFWIRLRGMIGRNFESIDAMIFPDCSSIHTFWMRMPIALIFLDRDGRVLGQRATAPAWRVFFGPRGTRTIVELAPDSLRAALLEPGDRLSW
jgi:uncharacterized membrane protein (UPF0127 family)